MTALVSIKQVVKGYTRGKQRVEVLHSIDLTVEHGEFLALMGPSGSGKTTLLNLIGGLDRPDRGEITVAGERIDRLSSGPARQMARAQRRLHLPVLQPAARPHGRAQCRGSAAADEALGGRAEAQRRRGARARRACGSRQAQAGRALGRAAAARCDRTGARRRSDAARLRRADGRPRPRDLGVDLDSC